MSRSALLIAFVATGMIASFPAFAGTFDGKWTGKWDGKAPAEIRVANDKVTSYNFRGKYQLLGTTSVTGKKLTFGNGKYKIIMTMTAPSEANAAYSGFGQHSTAHFTRK
jgi:hypothetical protein